jgi:LPS export ABC transporter protein LptC
MKLKRSDAQRPFSCFVGGWAFFWALLSATFLVSCANEGAEEEAEQVAKMSADGPVNIIEGGTFRYTERGESIHMLRAARMERSGEEDAEDGSLLEVSGGFTLYMGGDENNWEARLTALRGAFDEANLHLTAWDEVVLENAKGDRLETEQLTWAQDSDRVWTHRPVTIATADGIIEGEGLESDGRFQEYTILKPRGAIEIEVSEAPSTDLSD